MTWLPRFFSESSMQIHACVITFRTAASGEASRLSWYWRFFADDDPCAPAELDLQIQKIGADLNFCGRKLEEFWSKIVFQIMDFLIGFALTRFNRNVMNMGIVLKGRITVRTVGDPTTVSGVLEVSPIIGIGWPSHELPERSQRVDNRRPGRIRLKLREWLSGSTKPYGSSFFLIRTS
jgi:hypothetical protein